MAESMIGLVSGFMPVMRKRDADRERSDRTVAMRRFVEQNLADPNLGLETLQEEFPASRAVLYRAFKGLGGLQRHIARQRMRRALTMLTIGGDDMTIGQVAEAVGYTDQRRFSRAFVREFGTTPSGARDGFTTLADVQSEEIGTGSGQGIRIRAMLDHSNTE